MSGPAKGRMPAPLSPDIAALRLLRSTEVAGLTGLSVSRVKQLEARGDFPRRIWLGERAMGYRLSDVLAWIDARAAESAPAGHATLHQRLPMHGGKPAAEKGREVPMVTRGNRFPTPARKASTATGGK